MTVSVHGTCGLWGLVALGLFADGHYGDGFNGVTGAVKGLFYGHAGQLWAQLASVVVLLAWCSGACIVFFTLCKKTIGLRSDADAFIFDGAGRKPQGKTGENKRARPT